VVDRADRRGMDAHDLIGKRVTITDIDLDAYAPGAGAHVAIDVDGGPALVSEADLHQTRAKAVLTLRGEPPAHSS
jgi:hypothetical protein